MAPQSANAFYRVDHLEWASSYVQYKITQKLRYQNWSEVLKKIVKGGDEVSRGLLFELYVIHLFRSGNLQLPFRDLKTGEAGIVTIPATPRVVGIRTTSDFSRFTDEACLFIPSIPNFPCIDLALGPDMLFQVTVSEAHLIKQEPLQEIIDGIITSYPERSNELTLYYVVPSNIYDNFMAQKYVVKDNQEAKRTPGYLDQVRQCVIKIDMDSAY